MKNFKLKSGLTCLLLLISISLFGQNEHSTGTKETIYAAYSYDWIDDFSHGVALARKGKDFFAIDTTGNILFQLKSTVTWMQLNFNKFGHSFFQNENHQYVWINKEGKEEDLPIDFNQKIRDLGDGQFYCEHEGVYGIYSLSEEKFVPLDEKVICSYGDSSFVVQRNNKFGVMDFNQQIIIPFEYNEIKYLNQGVFLLRKKSKYLLQKANKKLGQAYYDKIELSSPYYIARKNGKYGIINQENEILIPFEYTRIDKKNSKYFRVYKDDYQGVLNKDLEIVVPVKYKSMKHIGRTYHFRNETDTLFFDQRNVEVVEIPILTKSREEREAEYAVRRKSIKKPKSSETRMIDGTEYDFIREQYGLMYLWKDRKSGIANRKGEFIVPLDHYQSIQIAPSGLRIKKNALFGFYDLTGKKVLDIVYKKIAVRHNGLFFNKKTVEDKSLSGYHSLDETVKIPANYSRLTYINDTTFIAARKYQELGILHANKIDQCLFQYKRIFRSGENRLVAENQNSKYGIIDTNEKIIVPFEYEEIKPFKEDFLQKRETCGKGLIMIINLFQLGNLAVLKEPLNMDLY